MNSPWVRYLLLCYQKLRNTRRVRKFQITGVSYKERNVSELLGELDGEGGSLGENENKTSVFLLKVVIIKRKHQILSMMFNIVSSQLLECRQTQDHGIHDTGSWDMMIRDHKMDDTGYGIDDTGYGIDDTEYEI